jgi:transposase InsO family protein
MSFPYCRFGLEPQGCAGYGEAFTRRLRAMGIRDRPTAPRSPWQNGHTERLIGPIRRECLDHVVVFGERHLRHVLISYMAYYNGACFGGEVSFILCFGVLALPLGRSPLRLLAGGEAVAFAIHLQDMDMMSEPVE